MESRVEERVGVEERRRSRGEGRGWRGEGRGWRGGLGVEGRVEEERVRVGWRVGGGVQGRAGVEE